MKTLRQVGLGLFVVAMTVFIGSLFVGQWTLTPQVIQTAFEKPEHIEAIYTEAQPMLGQPYSDPFSFVNALWAVMDRANAQFVEAQDWGNVLSDYDKQKYAIAAAKAATEGFLAGNQGLVFWASIMLGVIGALLYIFPKRELDGPPGIKNNGIFQHAATSRGWVGILAGTFLISFYVLLYWKPYYITNWILLVDPLAMAMKGQPANQWFLYGFLYTLAITVMGIRMLIKYRHSNYHLVRTSSVMFFQIAFAFLIPQVLAAYNLPDRDLKNIFPLDYSLFYDYNLQTLSGTQVGVAMLSWGILLFVVGVPTLVYFFGKRWYCSWVCGCGGLAETLGDPYRQLSDKSLTAWRVERWLIHGVMVFIAVVTSYELYAYFGGSGNPLGISHYELRSWYGFLIGAAFAGVIGTGFYPFMGNRVWCRFGCPLAAYLGMVQRFQSRFRITTNGGQCISCGNCSTYCEMGIDVRWYAQRGQDIVRSSCVGCGVCSSVCPRGVLKLENSSAPRRLDAPPIIVGRKEVTIHA